MTEDLEFKNEQAQFWGSPEGDRKQEFPPVKRKHHEQPWETHHRSSSSENAWDIREECIHFEAGPRGAGMAKRIVQE